MLHSLQVPHVLCMQGQRPVCCTTLANVLLSPCSPISLNLCSVNWMGAPGISIFILASQHTASLGCYFLTHRNCEMIINNCEMTGGFKRFMCVHAQLLSCVWLSVTPWTVAHEAPLSMGFPRQEHWSRVPFPLPGDLPDLGIECTSPALAAGLFTTWATWETL